MNSEDECNEPSIEQIRQKRNSFTRAMSTPLSPGSRKTLNQPNNIPANAPTIQETDRILAPTTQSVQDPHMQYPTDLPFKRNENPKSMPPTQLESREKSQNHFPRQISQTANQNLEQSTLQHQFPQDGHYDQTPQNFADPNRLKSPVLSSDTPPHIVDHTAITQQQIPIQNNDHINQTRGNHQMTRNEIGRNQVGTPTDEYAVYQPHENRRESSHRRILPVPGHAVRPNINEAVGHSPDQQYSEPHYEKEPRQSPSDNRPVIARDFDLSVVDDDQIPSSPSEPTYIMPNKGNRGIPGSSDYGHSPQSISVDQPHDDTEIYTSDINPAYMRDASPIRGGSPHGRPSDPRINAQWPEEDHDSWSHDTGPMHEREVRPTRRGSHASQSGPRGNVQWSEEDPEVEGPVYERNVSSMRRGSHARQSGPRINVQWSEDDLDLKSPDTDPRYERDVSPMRRGSPHASHSGTHINLQQPHEDHDLKSPDIDQRYERDVNPMRRSSPHASPSGPRNNEQWSEEDHDLKMPDTIQRHERNVSPMRRSFHASPAGPRINVQWSEEDPDLGSPVSSPVYEREVSPMRRRFPHEGLTEQQLAEHNIRMQPERRSSSSGSAGYENGNTSRKPSRQPSRNSSRSRYSSDSKNDEMESVFESQRRRSSGQGVLPQEQAFQEKLLGSNRAIAGRASEHRLQRHGNIDKSPMPLGRNRDSEFVESRNEEKLNKNAPTVREDDFHRQSRKSSAKLPEPSKDNHARNHGDDHQLSVKHARSRSVSHGRSKKQHTNDLEDAGDRRRRRSSSGGRELENRRSARQRTSFDGGDDEEYLEGITQKNRDSKYEYDDGRQSDNYKLGTTPKDGEPNSRQRNSVNGRGRNAQNAPNSRFIQNTTWNEFVDSAFDDDFGLALPIRRDSSQNRQGFPESPDGGRWKKVPGVMDHTDLDTEIDLGDDDDDLSICPSGVCSNCSRTSSRASMRSNGSRRQNGVRRMLPAPQTQTITKEPERMYKVVLAGDAAVGKSSFILRLCKNKFISNLNSTLGVDFQTKTIELDGRIIALQLWDTAGQERFRSIAKSYFRRADGVLLVYDCTYERSFINVREWVDTVEDGAVKKLPIMFVANKTDLREEFLNDGRKCIKCVDTEEGQRLAREYDGLFIETSAKHGDNILEAVTELTRLMRANEDLEVQNVGLHLQDVKEKNKILNCCTL